MFVQTYRFTAAAQNLALKTVMSAALRLFSTHFLVPQQSLLSKRECPPDHRTGATDSTQITRPELSRGRHPKEPTVNPTLPARNRRHQRRPRARRVCVQCKESKIGCVKKTKEGQACDGAYPSTYLHHTARMRKR